MIINKEKFMNEMEHNSWIALTNKLTKGLSFDEIEYYAGMIDCFDENYDTAAHHCEDTIIATEFDIPTVTYYNNPSRQKGYNTATAITNRIMREISL